MTVREREATQRGGAEDRPPVLARAVRWPTGAIAGLTVAGFTPWPAWVADLAGAFRPHYAAAGVVCLAGMAVARRWTGVLIAAGVVAVNAAVVAPLWLDAPAPAPAGAPTLTVLWHNVYGVAQTEAQELADAIMDADVDVVMLAQVHPSLSRALRHDEGLAHDVVYHDDERTLVLARAPVSQVGPVGPLPPGSREAAVALQAEVSPDVSVAILGIHTRSPRSPRRARVRNAELALAASWAGAQDGPTVVVGDLNTPPWSVPFRDIARFGGLIDSLRGHGLQPTWPASLGIAGIPIDHALHSPDLAVVSRTTGPALGSPHRSLRVTLTLAPGRASGDHAPRRIGEAG